MVNSWFVENSARSCRQGTRCHKDATTSIDHLERRRESHPLCYPSRKHSGSLMERPSSTIPVKDWCDFLTVEKGARSPRSPHSQLSPRSPRALKAPQCSWQAGPCSRRASCDWMVELIGGVPNRQAVFEVCQRVLQHVCEALTAERCSFALVKEDSGGRHLSGTVFCANDDIFNNDFTHPSWDKCIMEHVVATGNPINIMDVYEDPRFSSGVDQNSLTRPKSILSMLVRNPREEVVGVVMVINKKPTGFWEGCVFSQQDEKVLVTHMSMLGVILDNAQLCENAEQESKRNQVLLDLASLLSEQHDSQESLLNKMAHAILPVTKAQLCSVFIADTDDMKSMETLNVANVAEQPGTELQSLICTPVRNGRRGTIIGVCQLVNKQSEGSGEMDVFSRADERLLEDFAVYCGLGLQNFRIMEAAEKTRAKQEVTREVLSYHISASKEEILALQEAAIPSAQSLSILDFGFSDFGLSDSITTQATVRMFLDLNLVQDFSIDYKSLCQWVLSVRRGYRRDVAYHNWSHAITTAQCMFAMLMATGDLQSQFSSLEILALMIATLCHDLDHRGVNNSYITRRSQQPLAQLYGHSSLEHHHFDLCLLILNNPGSEILSGLSQEDYRLCLEMIEKNILATDLALYMRRRSEFFHLVKGDKICWQDQKHRELLRSMLMTASDISAITKPWPVQKRIANLVATEFFAQGDREKHEFKIRPLDVMNRDNSNRLPDMQVEYIDGICSPLYEANLYDSCSPLLKGCEMNRKNWQHFEEGEESDE
uniref:Phosphodiesterase n=1 Tax=Denticeps clupeoides TaxID=299321 RepID=A0AAY4B1K8_9TELE